MNKVVQRERGERKGTLVFLNEVVGDLSAREEGIELGNFPKVRSIVAANARC